MVNLATTRIRLKGSSHSCTFSPINGPELTCISTLCPPGTSQLLHHPLTLPCGHTLSSEHLSLPSPAPLPANFASMAPHDQHAHQQRQSQQRLSLWAGIMCPIPSCKRYSPYAIPGETTHEPLSPIAAFMAPPGSLPPSTHQPHKPGVALASGVMYYPPPPPAHSVTHPPPAYSPDPPTNEMGSPLLDTAVDKVQYLVMRELGLGVFSKQNQMLLQQQQQQRSHTEAEHISAAVEAAGGAERVMASTSGDTQGQDAVEMPHKSAPHHSHLSTSLSMDLSRTTIDANQHHQHSHHEHDHLAHVQRPPTPDRSGSTESAASESTVSSLGRKISKRRKNTMGEPARPELSFEKELMGILECDVCAMLLYEPITTPCQHVSWNSGRSGEKAVKKIWDRWIGDLWRETAYTICSFVTRGICANFYSPSAVNVSEGVWTIPSGVLFVDRTCRVMGTSRITRSTRCS